jgi:hypothetical protein
VNILDMLHSPRALKPAFGDLASWHGWEIFLSAVFGLGISEGSDLELFRKCTGLEAPPEPGIREVYCISGRRSGKSRITAAIAVYLAAFCDWRKVLVKGERGKVLILAVDRAQARVMREYIGGALNSSASLRGLITAENKESIELTNGIDIEIATSSYRSIRGRTVVCAILEEAAFWRADEMSANPARDVYVALKPSLATTPGSLLVAISTAYAKEGLMHEAKERYFGKPGRTLCWLADSLTMNPTLDRELIEEELEKDPDAAGAEWLSIERSDMATYIDGELVGDLVVRDRFELPKIEGVSYSAFVDPAGGSGRDAMTLAVCHIDAGSDRIVQDCIRVQRPPFNPKSCVLEFATTLKAYGIGAVTGDRYSGDWCASAFRDEGIDYQNSERNRSEIYLEFLPLLMQRRVDLLDHRQTIAELRQLERRSGRGRDSIDHPKGAHDDSANAVAGAAVLASGVGGRPAPNIRTLRDDSSFEQKIPRPFGRPLMGQWNWDRILGRR